MAKSSAAKGSSAKRASTFFGRMRPRLNGYLHRYSRLRGVRWTRYSKSSKLREEFGELMEALKDYESDPSKQKLLHLKEESADLFFCIVGIAERNGFDLHDALEHKIRKDRGRNGKKHR